MAKGELSPDSEPIGCTESVRNELRIYISSRKFLRSTVSRLGLAFLDFWEVLAALAAAQREVISNLLQAHGTCVGAYIYIYICMYVHVYLHSGNACPVYKCRSVLYQIDSCWQYPRPHAQRWLARRACR